MMKKKKIIAGMVSVALLLSGCGGSTTEKVASLSKLGVDKSEIIISDKTDIKDTTYLLETTYSGADVRSNCMMSVPENGILHIE